MAELTVMESKIGEVAGLAMAAKSATSKVMRLAKDSDEQLVGLLMQMNEEAAETEKRCTALAGSFEGKKTAILEEAKETKDKGAKMLEIYLDADSDVLDGFEFLTMAEAGEVGHWEILEQIANTARRPMSRADEMGDPDPASSFFGCEGDQHETGCRRRPQRGQLETSSD